MHAGRRADSGRKYQLGAKGCAAGAGNASGISRTARRSWHARRSAQPALTTIDCPCLNRRFRGAGLYYGAGAAKPLSAPAMWSSSEAAIQERRRRCTSRSCAAGDAGRPGRQSEADSVGILIERIQSAKNVEVVTNTDVTALEGQTMLKAVVLTNTRTGERRRIDTHWVFVCIGGAPRTGDTPARRGARRAGYLVTGPDLFRGQSRFEGWPLDRPPCPEKSHPGLFAAGDVRHDSVKRCASAVGEGVAITFVHRYLADG